MLQELVFGDSLAIKHWGQSIWFPQPSAGILGFPNLLTRLVPSFGVRLMPGWVLWNWNGPMWSSCSSWCRAAQFPRVVHQPDIYRTPYVILMGLRDNLQGSIVFTWCSFVVFNLHFFVPCFARKKNGRKGNAQNRHLLTPGTVFISTVTGGQCSMRNCVHVQWKSCIERFWTPIYEDVRSHSATESQNGLSRWESRKGMKCEHWLVVWNIFYFSIQLGMSSSQLTLTPSFFWGVETTQPPTGNIFFPTSIWRYSFLGMWSLKTRLHPFLGDIPWGLKHRAIGIWSPRSGHCETSGRLQESWECHTVIYIYIYILYIHKLWYDMMDGGRELDQTRATSGCWSDTS